VKKKLLLKGARLVDPAAGVDERRDLLIERGKVVGNDRTIVADGQLQNELA